MKLEDATIGQRVTFKDGIKTEHGKVTSKNSTFIFVKFDHSISDNGVACYPNNLRPEYTEQEVFDQHEEDNPTDLEEALDILLNS